jgi:methionine-gamma-lyase
MLIARGARTLALRMERASASALTLARRLSDHPRVERVAYPGLPSHPGHEIATRQMERGFGALIAFEVRGGLRAGARVYDAVQLIARAVSLGDVRSLLTHAASTTHASLTAEQREHAGIGEGLMRLSVGVEDVEDLYADLEQALAGA